MAFRLPKEDELNNTQKLIINLLSDSNKLAVIGGPGTGKTIIVINAVRQMAKSPNKCLILTHSKCLINQIKCIAGLYNFNTNNIEISTYHSWFSSKLNKLGFKDANNKKDFKDFQEEKKYVYNLTKLENFLSNIDSTKKLEYDYIFVDEAQDVQEGLIRIFSQFGRKIIVTFDDCQKIGNENMINNMIGYEHSNILNELGIGDRFFDLIENYRNTSQIETIGRQLFHSFDYNDITLRKTTSTRYGDNPVLLLSKGNFSYDEFARYLIDHYDKSKSCAVLFDSSIDNCEEVFKSLKHSIETAIKLANRNIKFYYKFGSRKENENINDENALDNAIFLMSFRVSKGLEFDDVYILTTGATINTYQKRNAFYVAFTRAKSMVYIALDNNSNVNKEVNELFSENKYLFDVDIL